MAHRVRIIGFRGLVLASLCLASFSFGVTLSVSDAPVDVPRLSEVPLVSKWIRLRNRVATGRANLAGHWRDELETLDGNPKARAPLAGNQEGFAPGQPAPPFRLHTLAGVLTYPGPQLAGGPVLLHAFDNRSAFLECLWTSHSSLATLVKGSPANAKFVFVPTGSNATVEARWMQGRLDGTMKVMQRQGQLEASVVASLQSRFHFSVMSVYQLGNWIPSLLQQWACQDHGCGLTQVLFQSFSSRLATHQEDGGIQTPIVLKRLDARYDWLPSPGRFGNKTIPVAASGDGCQKDGAVAKKIAVVTAGGCSFSEKVSTMQQSQAVAVIIYADQGQPVQDMNCEGAECDSPPGIPASMVPYNQELFERLTSEKLYASFQTTPTNAFHFGIDAEGLLSEMGWFLYPSFQFLNWQAEWFNYKTALVSNLSREALVIPVFEDKVMQGDSGVIATVQLPSLRDMSQYRKIELDASLSCPGTRDESCPPWDHTINLYLCCNKTSHLCNMELGRWITPFRRRIGRWLTDVSPLFPLFTSAECTFTMKTVPWAQAWKPSLNLRLSMEGSKEALRPYNITPLFRGGTFDSGYNMKYRPLEFVVPPTVKKVQLYAVITGHGSDDNGCGEFCVTSHHFVVNSHVNNITFSNAGTPLGCALRTPTGVEPNEHGTWLYGRDGWCDGREVDPWVVDISPQLAVGTNRITYFGWYQGKDPAPIGKAGYITMYSYLVYYR